MRVSRGEFRCAWRSSRAISMLIRGSQPKKDGSSATVFIGSGVRVEGIAGVWGRLALQGRGGG
jgi:hypothetical protein